MASTHIQASGAPRVPTVRGAELATNTERDIPYPAEEFARGDLPAPGPSVEAVICRGKEVTKMLSNSSLRRLVTAGLVLGVLAAATPAAGLASNVGGGGHPVGQTR